MSRDIKNEIAELVRITSTDLPFLVEKKLRDSQSQEKQGSAAHSAIQTILDNVEMTRRNSTPICQDTGTPIFYVNYPQGWNPRDLREQIRTTIAEATKKAYLRPNAVNPITGKNSGNNLGDDHFPSIYFKEIDGDVISIDLILKGGGCENVGIQYSLPDTRLKADRDLEGVRRVVLDAVNKAQGEGCAPGFLGVAVGGDRGAGYVVSKEAFLSMFEKNVASPEVKALEERISLEANQLGIGPMGFGGKTTVLGTKILFTERLPASYFVTVSYMCWAFRRRKLTITQDGFFYE